MIRQFTIVGVTVGMLAGGSAADTITGYDLVDRPSDDSGLGHLHILQEPFAFDPARMGRWTFFDNDHEAGGRREITPLLVELVAGDVVIVAVGTTQTTTEAGVQEWPFGLVDGDDVVGSGVRFAWFDGSSTSESAGAVDYGPAQGGEPGTPILVATSGDIAVGNNLGPATLMPRTYSIQVSIEPPQAECDPPARAALDDQSMHVVSSPPNWVETTYGTYVNGAGVETPYDVSYFVPNDPIGLVYAFHGGGGGMGFANTNLDARDVLERLLEAGFAFVATESADREMKTWDWKPTTAAHTNAEFDRLIGIRDDILIPLTEVTADTPIYTYGFSSGSKGAMCFAHMAREAGYDVRAAAPQSTRSTPGLWALLTDLMTVPTFYMVGANETQRVCGVQRMHQDMLDRGVPSRFFVMEEKAIDPARYGRIPSIDGMGLEQQVFDYLVNGDPAPPSGDPIPGIMDANGMRSVPCDEQNSALNSLMANIDNVVPGLGAVTVEEIKVQTQIAWAQHRPTSEYREEIATFFVRMRYPEDVNQDGTVDVGDLLEVIGSWGTCPPLCAADVNHDGVVDVGDMLAVIAAWGPVN